MIKKILNEIELGIDEDEDEDEEFLEDEEKEIGDLDRDLEDDSN